MYKNLDREQEKCWAELYGIYFGSPNHSVNTTFYLSERYNMEDELKVYYALANHYPRYDKGDVWYTSPTSSITYSTRGSKYEGYGLFGLISLIRDKMIEYNDTHKIWD